MGTASCAGSRGAGAGLGIAIALADRNLGPPAPPGSASGGRPGHCGAGRRRSARRLGAVQPILAAHNGDSGPRTRDAATSPARHVNQQHHTDGSRPHRWPRPHHDPSTNVLAVAQARLARGHAREVMDAVDNERCAGWRTSSKARSTGHGDGRSTLRIRERRISRCHRAVDGGGTRSSQLRGGARGGRGRPAGGGWESRPTRSRLAKTNCGMPSLAAATAWIVAARSVSSDGRGQAEPDHLSDNESAAWRCTTTLAVNSEILTGQL